MENKNKALDWSSYYSFKAMTALKIIQAMYLFVACVITFAGALYLLFGMGMGNAGRIIGLLLLIFGNVFWRVWCELIIVFFRINETLNSIEYNTKRNAL